MKIALFGGAGFIGVNLARALAARGGHDITVIDAREEFFEPLRKMELPGVHFDVSEFPAETDFDRLLRGVDVVYHLVSTTNPSTSNHGISHELEANVVATSRFLESCVRTGVGRVIFISSGGTVYGKEQSCPLHEDTPTYPISSYGIQKITIEKLLYLYHYLHGLDYRVVRLANPYGPYQRPNGVLGAVVTFTYKALKNEEIIVYGDGSVVRDFIYIDDAVRGILQIAEGESPHQIFNLGCGYGTSIHDVLLEIEKALDISLNITYKEGRKVDVPVNYLDISRYEQYYGSLDPIPLREGILKTAQFMKEYYKI